MTLQDFVALGASQNHTADGHFRSSRIQQMIELRLRKAVALARAILQFSAIKDRDVATLVANEAGGPLATGIVPQCNRLQNYTSNMSAR
jgi:hypothetical protein